MRHKIPLDLFLRYCGNPETKELAQALTHQSFSTEKNNSRFVFNGMYCFKGQVADWCFSNIQGSGTQLQHFLGNITGKQAMDDFFDYVGLERKIRIAGNLKADDYKHIFSYGFLGWLCTVLDSITMKKVIYRFFIAPNDHLLPQTHRIHDPWQQLLFLCNQQGWAKPKRSILRANNGQYTCDITWGERQRISHVSNSYIYVQKRAIRLALKHIISELADYLEKSDTHQKLLRIESIKKQEAIESDRNNRIAQSEKKRQEKKLQKVVRLQRQQEKARLDEQRRKLARQLKKEKSGKKKQAIIKEYTDDEIRRMNASKRRNLEQKGNLLRS